MIEFGAINWSILIVYIVANLLLGVVIGKKIETDQDFYIGRKTTPWWAIGISVIATYVSALTFLGAPAWAYNEGLSVIAIHLNYPLVIMAVIIFFFPFFYNAGVASIYEYQEKRFGKRARALISSIWLVSQTMSSAAVLYATSVVLSFITGMDVILAIVIVTIIALVYTVLGGITAVIWTDVIQSVILFASAGIIFYALTTESNFSVMDSLGQLKEQGKLNPLLTDWDLSLTSTVWSGVIAMALYHTTVYGTNQMMVQRTLAAKNIGDAKKSYLLMGFVAFFIYFFFIVLGVLFYSYYQGKTFEDENTIILQFAADYGMPGLMGIIAAAVMAASMSSLDSAFNSLSTIATLDFYKKYFKKNESDAHYLKASRYFTVFWALIIIFPAIMYHLHSSGSILEVLSQVGSYFVGAQLGMFALGFFSKQATENGLLVGTGVGFIVVAAVALSTDIAWPWYCLIGAATNVIITIIASRLIDGKQTEVSEYTVKGQMAKFAREGLPEKENGWYRIPGKVDPINYWLFAFFIGTLIFLASLQYIV
ncbi:sodium/solute symporter [Psychrobium sp. MM17-31]|uniref:sodium:solute symporter family transporter n=1 Tax=Psychrobium sp. MM17-31 TaxID=2917758 RepID=UPI001EF70C6B|nr:sodium/solute symporter [Psychrobium sp. MM17-31]MCG7533187.1 sodium/solute symporter [Psychrobium sp. MM17-31]